MVKPDMHIGQKPENRDEEGIREAFISPNSKNERRHHYLADSPCCINAYAVHRICGNLIHLQRNWHLRKSFYQQRNH